MKKTVPNRNEIDVADTWDLETIFPTVAAWEEAVAQVPEKIANLARYKERLADDAATLADWLTEVEGVMREVACITVYASLDYSVDMMNQEAAARNDQARGLFARVMSAAAFAEPEILAIGHKQLQRWMREEPRLAPYAHYFDQLQRRRPHVRSTDVEELLKQVLDAFNTASATHRILTDADITFAPVKATPAADPIEIAQSNINPLLTHEDRAVRRSAWENYADSYLAHKNTLANCIAAGVKQDVFMARARCYQNSLEAALVPNHIPTEVFYNTIETFRQHLPIWHRYWRVRRKALGYDQLHVYDVKAPLTAQKPRVSFQQAVDWICKGMEPLGEEYVDVMRRGLLQERWVDRYPNKGKRSGAFSYGVPGTHPFIFMSFNDDLFSLSTLVHELGHSMHSYFSWRTQPFVYARYSLFVAEVASNFNQALVRSWLLQNESDRVFQIALLEEAMSNFHRYFFIMPTLARFELEIHDRVERGQALTADTLNTLMADLFEEGYGEEVVIDRDRIGITWAQFPNHLYANFYVFQYTTGIAGAHALAKRILESERNAAEDYLAFLKAGGSMYPLDALAQAGVDMTSPEPVAQAFEVLSNYVDQLEALTS